MAKLDARRAAAALADPAPWRCILLHGDDPGLVRERAAALVKAVIGGPDPFRLAEVPRDAAVKDQGLLAAEMSAMALTGGRRVIVLRDATDAVAPAVKAALAAPGDALLVIEAAELPARGRLRALLEAAAEAAVITCYRERGAELAATLRGLLAEAGVSADTDALEELASRLGEDRLLLRREVEKLALYVGEGGRATAEDVLACVGDGSALDLEEALMAATAGDVALADRALEAAMAEGGSAVGLLRAALRHVQRLHLAASGVAPEALRPPVFFRHKPAFERALRLWSAPALAAAAAALREAEKRAKSGSSARPMPDAALAKAAVLALARQAAVRRRG
ncbi:MAG: DNA polymerase III subunit delta [Acetobacteraceae bacterium]